MAATGHWNPPREPVLASPFRAWRRLFWEETQKTKSADIIDFCAMDAILSSFLRCFAGNFRYFPVYSGGSVRIHRDRERESREARKAGVKSSSHACLHAVNAMRVKRRPIFTWYPFIWVSKLRSREKVKAEKAGVKFSSLNNVDLCILIHSLHATLL